MSESIQCWQCGTRMTLDELASNDGDCPRCEVEVHLAEYLCTALSRVAALEAELVRTAAQRDAILQQARAWAGEAKTQRSTVLEVGEILGGIPDWGPIAAGVEAMAAELAKLRAGQEPVAVVKESQYLLGDTSDEISELLPIGTKLYTAPQPSAAPDMIELAAFIRQIDGNNRMGAGVLAERICEWIAATSAPATAQGDGWIPVSERLPESERTVLAFYLNSHGKGRRVRAEYIAAKTKSADDGWDSDEPADYDEQADEYFWPAGWYEVMDNWDDLTHMVIHEGEVTHWMPLPAAPKSQAGGQ